MLSPSVSPLRLRFAADVSRQLNLGFGLGLVADVEFYGFNKVFGSDYEPDFETD